MNAMLLMKFSKWCMLLPLSLSALDVETLAAVRGVLRSIKVRISELVRVLGTSTAWPSLSCRAISSTIDLVSPKRRNCCNVAISSSNVMMAHRSSTFPATSFRQHRRKGQLHRTGKGEGKGVKYIDKSRKSEKKEKEEKAISSLALQVPVGFLIHIQSSGLDDTPYKPDWQGS